MPTVTCPPIPTAAMPVVEVLRRDVPKPKTMGIYFWRGSCGWWRRGMRICPLGLHPLATTGLPERKSHLPETELTTQNIVAFFHWWDALTLDEPEKRWTT